MGEIRSALREAAARNLFRAPVFTRNFSRVMRLDAACSAPAPPLPLST